MCRVKAVLAEAHLPERLKDICQKQDVGATVQVAVVSQGLASKGHSDLLRMGVVLVTDMRIGELAVEGFLWGGGSLGPVKRSQASLYSSGTPHCRLGCPSEAGP